MRSSGAVPEQGRCRFVLQIIPRVPEFRKTTGHLDPVVTGEEEVVRVPLQSSKFGVARAGGLGGDVETGDVPEDLWRNARGG